MSLSSDHQLPTSKPMLCHPLTRSSTFGILYTPHYLLITSRTQISILCVWMTGRSMALQYPSEDFTKHAPRAKKGLALSSTTFSFTARSASSRAMVLCCHGRSRLIFEDGARSTHPIDRCCGAGLFVISLSAEFTKLRFRKPVSRITQRTIRQGVIPFYILRKTSHRHQTVVIIDLKAVKIYYMRIAMSTHELVMLGRSYTRRGMAMGGGIRYTPSAVSISFSRPVCRIHRSYILDMLPTFCLILLEYQ